MSFALWSAGNCVTAGDVRMCLRSAMLECLKTGRYLYRWTQAGHWLARASVWVGLVSTAQQRVIQAVRRPRQQSHCVNVDYVNYSYRSVTLYTSIDNCTWRRWCWWWTVLWKRISHVIQVLSWTSDTSTGVLHVSGWWWVVGIVGHFIPFLSSYFR